MSDYTPDKWVILKFEPEGGDTFYKVFGTWAGGYTDGDSWQMNSGITKVTEGDDMLHFHGLSGSVYSCHKQMYGVAGASNYAIINRLEELGKQNGTVVSIVGENTDFRTIEYGLE